MNKKLLVLLPALALLLGACGGNGGSSSSSSSSQTESDSTSESVVDPNVVTGVSINETAVTLDIGGTVTLRAAATPDTVDDASVSWSSDNEEVATVSENGYVTAVAPGTANIKATSVQDASKSATCVVTVNKRMVLVAAETPVIGTAYKFGLYQGNSKKMIYSDGRVQGGYRCDTTDNWSKAIDYKFEEGSAAGKYHLSYELEGTKYYLNCGDDHHLIHKAETATTDWEWDEETDSLKLTIGGTDFFPGTHGTFTTISLSEYSYLSKGNFVAHFYTRMEATDPTAIAVTPKTANVFAGGSVTLEAKLQPVNAYAEIEWTTDNEKATVVDGVVTVDETVAPGTQIVVTAKAGTLNDTATLTVKEKLNYGTEAAPLTIAEARALLTKVGVDNYTEERMYVKGVASYNDAWNTQFKNTTIKLASDDGMDTEGLKLFRATMSDELVTKYSAKKSLLGKVVVAEGLGKLSQNKDKTYFELVPGADNKNNPTVVSVSDLEAPRTLTEIKVSKTEVTIKAGESYTVYTDLLPVGATGTIVWTSTSEKVTCADGKISVAADAAPGDVTVTAAVGEIKATVTVTVEAADPAVALPTSLTIVGKQLPADTNWTYIPNNPSFPELRDFYTDAIKCHKYFNMGMESPKFVATNKVNVKINVNALNENTKEAGTDENVFTVIAFNAAGTEVARGGVKVTELTATGDYTVTLAAEGIAQVRVMYTNYANNGTKNCNVGLHAIEVTEVK